MKWWKVVFRHNGATCYCYGATEMEAMSNSMLLGISPSYEINECCVQEVPVVQHGLTVATVEQLRDELKRRGWKLTLS